jgi:hypothetical protein
VVQDFSISQVIWRFLSLSIFSMYFEKLSVAITSVIISLTFWQSICLLDINWFLGDFSCCPSTTKSREMMVMWIPMKLQSRKTVGNQGQVVHWEALVAPPPIGIAPRHGTSPHSWSTGWGRARPTSRTHRSQVSMGACLHRRCKRTDQSSEPIPLSGSLCQLALTARACCRWTCGALQRGAVKQSEPATQPQDREASESPTLQLMFLEKSW